MTRPVIDADSARAEIIGTFIVIVAIFLGVCAVAIIAGIKRAVIKIIAIFRIVFANAFITEVIRAGIAIIRAGT